MCQFSVATGSFAIEGTLAVDVERARCSRPSSRGPRTDVAAGGRHVDRVVDPLAVRGPADVELVHERAHRVRVVEVGEVLHVREVDALVLAEAPDVRAGVRALVERLRVQLAAAVVDGVGVVVRDALAAEVVERALHDAGDALRAGLVGLVLERAAGVRPAERQDRPAPSTAERQAPRREASAATRAAPPESLAARGPLLRHSSRPPSPRAGRRRRAAACPP